MLRFAPDQLHCAFGDVELLGEDVTRQLVVENGLVDVDLLICCQPRALAATLVIRLLWKLNRLENVV